MRSDPSSRVVSPGSPVIAFFFFGGLSPASYPQRALHLEFCFFFYFAGCHLGNFSWSLSFQGPSTFFFPFFVSTRWLVTFFFLSFFCRFRFLSASFLILCSPFCRACRGLIVFVRCFKFSFGFLIFEPGFIPPVLEFFFDFSDWIPFLLVFL